MDDGGLVQDLEDLGQSRLLVGLLHRAELPRQARRGGFENLPLRIALLRCVVGAEQVASHLGDRSQIARVDLRFIFLGAARPHGALDLRLTLQGLQRVLHRLVRRQLAHSNRVRLVDRNAESHLLLFEPEHVELQAGSGDFGALKLDDAANAMLGVNNIIADVEAKRLCSHYTPFRLRQQSRRIRYAPQNDQRPWLHACFLASLMNLRPQLKSPAAPCDSFISELRSNCESELGGDRGVDFGQVMEAETEQANALWKRMKSRQEGLASGHKCGVIRDV